MKKFLAAFTAALLAVFIVAAGTAPAQATQPVDQTNTVEYWQTLYGTTCYKYSPGDASPYGSITGGGYSVTLSTSGWGYLIVKGGAVDNGSGPGNTIYSNPSADMAYFPPANGGGQTPAVSHWFVCGSPTDPADASASATVTPGTCESAGSVSFSILNATWENTTDLTDGSRKAIATTGHTFPGGATELDVTYNASLLAQLTTGCDNAVASVSVTNPTCEAPGVATFTVLYATWDDASDTTDGSRNATAIPGHTFAGGLTHKTVTYDASLLSSLTEGCDNAVASVSLTNPTCLAPGVATFTLLYATWDDASDTTDGSRNATAVAGHTFPGGSTHKTVTYDPSLLIQLTTACANAVASVSVTSPTCEAPGVATFTLDYATWDDATDTTDGSRNATAVAGHTFPGGSIYKTVTYDSSLLSALTEGCDNAVASVSVTTPTCEAPGVATFTLDFATWDDATDTTDGSRNATAVAGHTFPGGSTHKTVTYDASALEALTGTPCAAAVPTATAQDLCGTASDSYFVSSDSPYTSTVVDDRVAGVGNVTVDFVEKAGYVFPTATKTHFVLPFTNLRSGVCGSLVTDPLVTPGQVTQASACDASGTYTIPATVGILWFIGTQQVQPGTYTVSSATSFTVTAKADGPKYGLESGVQTSWPLTFGIPVPCGQLKTLAFTGGSPSPVYAGVAFLLLALGIGGVLISKRTRDIQKG